MRKDEREGQKHVVKKRQRGGGPGRTPHQVLRTRQGILQSLTLDNLVAVAELRHQCEEPTVQVSVFIELLNLGYPPNLKDKGGGIDWIGPDGRPVVMPLPPNTAKAPRTRQETARALTLDNPVVKAWVLRQWEDGTMSPALRKWLVRNGDRRIDVKQTKRRLAFIGAPGLMKDPMAEQEAAAIAKAEAQDKMEEQARQAREQEQQGPVAGEPEAEEPEELEVYREKGDWG